MNPTDILKEIVLGGRKSGGGGGGFKDVFGGGRREPEVTTASDDEIARQARELEEMMGIGKPRQRPAPSGDPWEAPRPEVKPPPLPGRERPGDREQAEALVLIRAMVQAAKADGRLSREEQQAIVGRLGSDPRAQAYLRQEFDRPVDPRELAWSVPLGLEAKTYLLALSAIEPDTAAERDFLDTLAHGLRLDPDKRRELHRQVRWP